MAERTADLVNGKAGVAGVGAGDDASPPRVRSFISKAAIDSATDKRRSCETAAPPPADTLGESEEAESGGGAGG